MAEDIKTKKLKVKYIIKQALYEGNYRYEELKPEEPEGDYILFFSEEIDNNSDNIWSLRIQPKIEADTSRLRLLFRLEKIHCESTQVDAIIGELNTINQEVFMGNFYLGKDMQIYFKISVDFTFLELNMATIIRLIALGNSSVSEHYGKLNDLAQGQNNG